MHHNKNQHDHIKSKSDSCGSINSRSEEPVWNHSGNTFRFNFLVDDTQAPLEETSSSPHRTEPVSPVTPVENMETIKTPDDFPASQQRIQEETSSMSQEVNSPPESQEPSKQKKKKKSGKKKSLNCTESPQNPSSMGEMTGVDGAELRAEEQLSRQLDWCIEQLELGMRSKKGTQKQKEEASRALKTLRSSKAPHAKKRQVMRAMTQDYRKKMEEEKGKQYKIIQREITSAQVKVVSEPSKNCLYHRGGGVKTKISEKDLQKPDAQDTDPTPAFVFSPSKEKFSFNFF